jgi:REP element-mobilizing transposase RayT
MFVMRIGGVLLLWKSCPTTYTYLLMPSPQIIHLLIMNRIKGRASHFLRKEFPELLKLPTLWTPSYFVSTAGNICTETVKGYIAQQRE